MANDKKAVVAIAKEPTVQESVTKVFDLLGGVTNMIKSCLLYTSFGTKGWTVIGFEIVMLFFMTGITVDGLNTIVPMMAEYHSWNPDVLLSISTPASIIALFACVLWAAFIEKAGLKKTTIITMVLAGISMIAYGNSENIAMYAVSLVCVVTFINAFACNCGFAICANWFPTKKGIVMGITTIGMNLASALILSLIHISWV